MCCEGTDGRPDDSESQLLRRAYRPISGLRETLLDPRAASAPVEGGIDVGFQLAPDAERP